LYLQAKKSCVVPTDVLLQSFAGYARGEAILRLVFGISGEGIKKSGDKGVKNKNPFKRSALFLFSLWRSILAFEA
jgi:hypothetical protein